MYADHLLLFQAEQRAREAGRHGRPVSPRVRPDRIRERAGNHLISIGVRLRGRPPDPWPRPVRG